MEGLPSPDNLMEMHSDEKVGKYLDSRDKRNAATGSNHRHERNQ